MKRIILLVVFCIAYTISSAQIAYYDAITLSNQLDSLGQFDTIYKNHVEILKHYLSDEDQKLKDEHIILKYSENVFFGPFLRNNRDSIIAKRAPNLNFLLSTRSEKLNKIQKDKLNSYGQSTPKSTPISFSSVSGLDVTNLAQGLSQFMIERAKEELNVAFFERFKKITEENEEISLLFPITTERLSNILSFHYSQMISQLREAFYEDLNNLPDNVIKLLEEGKDFKDIKTPEIQIALNSIKLIRKIEYLAPPEIIKELPGLLHNVNIDTSDTNLAHTYENLKTSLNLTEILSQSVRDTTKKRNWISSNDFYEKILKDTTTTKIYLGLLYQQILNEKLRINGKLLTDTLKYKAEWNWYKERITEFIYLINKVDYTAGEIKRLQKEESKVGNSQIHSYINTTLEVVSFGNQFVNKYSGNSKALNDFLLYAQKANDIYKYTYQQQYSSAIMTTADLFKEILPNIQKNVNLDSILEINKEAKTVTGYIKVNDKFKKDKPCFLKKERRRVTYIKLKAKRKIRKEKNVFFKKERAKIKSNDRDILRKQFVEDFDSLNTKKIIQEFAAIKQNDFKWLEDLIKYGNFMAGLVNAETPEDAKNLIKAVALPSGSTTIKKNADFNIGINGYLGGSYRFNYSDKVETAWKAKWAVSAPIGISISTGFRKGGSLSLTGVLLDVGAIVDYQLSSDSTMSSKITLGNLFSPGGYLVYGMAWDLPISIGIGAQYGPGLTKIYSEKTLINSPNWRFGAFIAVDIPFFNIYNKSKRKF